MRPPPWLIRTLAGRLESKQLAAHRDAQRVQEKLLMRLVNLYRHTEIGRHVGLGAQYKHYRYSYDRGVLVSELGGEVTYEGFQVFASFLF